MHSDMSIRITNLPFIDFQKVGSIKNNMKKVKQINFYFSSSENIACFGTETSKLGTDLNSSYFRI